MPELPEVETLVRGLQPYAKSELLELKIFDKKVWFESELKPAHFSKLLLQSIRRRGKYLIYDFGDAFILQHLRMTGKMLPLHSSAIPEKIRDAVGETKQLRCEFRFSCRSLYFYDTRRFGTLTAVKNLESYWRKKKIAPDPIETPAEAFAHFSQQMKKSGKPAKTALLDQTIIAGVGNIYADEALFAVGVHPLREAKKVRELENLFAVIREILARAIEARGTTIYNYVNADGESGGFALELKVYGQDGKSCFVCKSSIKRIVVGGRATHFCMQCQPKR